MLYASPRPDNTTIGLLMIRNTLPGLTSLVSNCIGRMHVHEYGDNINNPYWIIHPVCQQGTVQSGGASVMKLQIAIVHIKRDFPPNIFQHMKLCCLTTCRTRIKPPAQDSSVFLANILLMSCVLTFVTYNVGKEISIPKHHQRSTFGLKSLPSGLLSGIKRPCLKIKEVLKVGKEESISANLYVSVISPNAFFGYRKNR
ncbi:hypothetical protein AVEN_148224-1 [Araneus ventricosus]|uniref:Uncharacterized protein n=1 Tax=Araneus ventricosus TaxID=182803 RepID=A0A4Y2PY29_ARAVE|nr:hypothetical protein AVEN_148224-1 [Araneus ventricosus]